LPTEDITKAVVAEMKSQNILAGNFYWYDNNWHYIRKWDHLKNPATLSALHPQLKQSLLESVNKDFTPSDHIMSRCISTAMSLLWTEEQINEKGEKIITIIKKVLQQQGAKA
jgi:8-amino-3,8-dideoxy-alpha-D-manno-octulosonate transaminase